MSADRASRTAARHRVGLWGLIAAALLAIFGTMLSSPPASAASAPVDKLAFTMVHPPAGFDDLLQTQRTVVDIYYGGQRVGEAPVVYRPGEFRFEDVPALLALLPPLVDPTVVRRSLTDSHLDPNVTLACGPNQSSGCGELTPSVAGIIFDSQRFRVDVFVAHDQLRVRSGMERAYLDAPPSSMALVDAFGATIAGSNNGPANYTIQNQAVMGNGAARLRADTSISSDAGVHIETLAAELDRPDLRYSAGLLWAPGIDLVGRKKMLGVGVSTQLDTRLDKYLLQGSPLILFLSRRARVDILRDGRLLTSRTYEAGNQSLDTSSLPSGSYDITLRVQEAGGGTREERRFFIKNALVAPMGQSLFFAYGGVLANDGDQHPIGLTRTPFLQVGVARRISPQFALDASIVGIGDHVTAEIGAYAFTGIGQFRAASLADNRGDAGLLLQANSLGRSAFGYAFDLRKLWNSRQVAVASPGAVPIGNGMIDRDLDESSGRPFTQINAHITYRLGQARLGLSGYYRHDRQESSYAVGPTAYWPLIRKNGFEFAFDGNFTQSSRGRTGYVGLTLQLLRGQGSINGAVGVRSANHRAPGADTKGGTVATIGGSWNRENILGGDASIAGAYERTPDEDSVRISASSRSDYGSAFLDTTRTLSGARQGVQYSASFQTGLAITGDALALGGRDRGEGSIVVRLDGDAANSVFEVLIDDSPQGRIHPGESLPLFVAPYRRYAVRIRPADGDRASYDGKTRSVSIYPGTVATLKWTAQPVVAAFGRAVWADGSPVAYANVTGKAGIGQTDEQGYFQVETGTAETLNLRARDGRMCNLIITGLRTLNGYAPLGEQRCQTLSHPQYAERTSP